MEMNKGTFAELRKLRKREKAFLNALDLIELCPDADKKSIVDNCRERLKEIDEKEDFLRKLESPRNDSLTVDAEDILNKIRARANRPPTTTTQLSRRR